MKKISNSIMIFVSVFMIIMFISAITVANQVDFGTEKNMPYSDNNQNSKDSPEDIEEPPVDDDEVPADDDEVPADDEMPEDDDGTDSE